MRGGPWAAIGAVVLAGVAVAAVVATGGSDGDSDARKAFRGEFRPARSTLSQPYLVGR